MPKKVLVVDDSSTVRQQVTSALTEAGYLCVEARDGADALAKIKEHPDLVLMVCDVHMPNLTGVDMVERLRANKTRPDLPIVMLTTETNVKLMERVKAAGAKGWIVKPFKKHLFVATVRKLAGPA
jgi:two-component system chemotaxis response regulator CheY